jgi:tetratricopeptide (TPR) repeat protein
MLDEPAADASEGETPPGEDGALALADSDPAAQDPADADAPEALAEGEEKTPRAREAYWCTVRATFKREAGELKEAVEIVDACLQAHPADGELLSEAINVYGAAGQYDRILEALRAAHAERPEEGGLRNALVSHLESIGRSDEAEQVMRDALAAEQANDPPRVVQTAAIWVDLAGFLIEAGRVEEGLDAYDEALELLGDLASADLRFRFADALILAKRYDRALEVIASSPVEVYPPMIRGRVAFERGDFETAFEELDQVALMWPDNAPTHYYLARSAEALGDLDRAVEEYRQAVRSDPTLIAPRERLVRLHLAEGRVRDADAIAGFVSAKKGGAPPSLALRLLDVEIRTRLGDEPDLAIAPDADHSAREVQAMTIDALSRGLERGSGTETAVDILAQIETQVQPRTRDLFARAQIELLMKHDESLDRAVELARTKDRELPGRPIIDLALGRALVRRGIDLEEAERRLESVVAADPERADALASLGDLARSRGDLEASLGWYDRALASEPGHWQSAAGRFAALRALGREDQARAALESYLAVGNPYDGHAALELAQALDADSKQRRIALAHRAIRFGAGQPALELLSQLDPEAAGRYRSRALANPQTGTETGVDGEAAPAPTPADA